MKKILLTTILITPFILGACTKQIATNNPTTSNTIPQAEYQEQVQSDTVVSSGNPETDLQAIENDIKDLDAAADFNTFSQTDLTQ